MIVPTAVQTGVRNGRVTGQSAREALSEFARDAGHFVSDNVLLVVVLVGLAVLVFQVTRPRVH